MKAENVYNCIIVEDDEIDRLTNVSFVERYPFLKLIGVFSSADEALASAKISQADVALLDIDMEGTTGLEFRRQLMDITACIFITFYPDYAVESFELAALDFLVKPVRSDRFDAAMRRLQAFLDLKKKAELFEYSLGGDTVYIKEGHEQVKLRLQDILYLEALRDYTRIVTNKNKYCVLSSLGNLLKEKPFQTFLRVHRSYAVQKNFINRITAQQVFVNDIELPIGRSYKEALDNIQL